MRPARLVSPLLATCTLALSACASASAGVSIYGGAEVIPVSQVGSVDLTKLPLGDDRISTSPKRGYVDRCGGTNTAGNAPGQRSTPAWVHGTTWSLPEKTAITGHVTWPSATFSNVLSDNVRKLTGNSLPVGGYTGDFSDQPGGVAASSYDLSLPAKPTVAAAPSCIGGEVGILRDGTALFNAFDGLSQDAVAKEYFDTCDGHPNQAAYHRHWIPTCFKDPGKGQSGLVGYAFDGFGIYGHRGPGGKVMTNKDLDACHGITSEVVWNGRKVRMYHYVATWEFPYTVGCFRGTSTVKGPPFGSATQQQGSGQQQSGGAQQQPPAGQGPPPAGSPGPPPAGSPGPPPPTT